MDKKLIDLLKPGSTIIVEVTEADTGKKTACRFMIIDLGPVLNQLMEEKYPDTVSVIDLDTGIFQVLPKGLEYCVLNER